MRLKLTIVAAAAVALSSGLAFAQEVVTIAHVGPTSGAIAHLGKDNENGAKMAVEELNAQGVVIAGKKVTIKLMTEDDAADPKQGTAVAQKLADAKVSGVIGHLNSGTTIPASKIYSDAGIPQVSPSATNPKYTRQGFKTAFRLVADDTQLGGTLGRYAVKELKGKSIADVQNLLIATPSGQQIPLDQVADVQEIEGPNQIQREDAKRRIIVGFNVRGRTAYGQGVAQEFKKAVEAAGGTVVANEFTTDKSTDFNSILTTIKGKKADVVFFGGMDAVAGPMLRQMKSLGINAKFMGGDGICSTELVKLAGDAVTDNQVYCAEAGGVEGKQKAGMEAFRAKFKAKFGTEVQVYAPYVYDGVKLMVAAMEKAGSSDPAKYLPTLAATKDYHGVTGDITFDNKGDILNGALTLKTIRGGKLVELAVIR